MTDETKELEMLREEARALRAHPDAAMLARVRSGVRARIAAPVSALEILAGWLRPVAIALAAILIAFAATFTFLPESLSPDAVALAAERMLIDEVTIDGP
jgi:hypothetical protein